MSGLLAGNLATDFAGFVLAEAGPSPSPELLIAFTLDAVALTLDEVEHVADGPRKVRAILTALLDQIDAGEAARWREHRRRRSDSRG